MRRVICQQLIRHALSNSKWLSYENFSEKAESKPVCPRVSERNSIIAEIASENESYLSRNESDPDSVCIVSVSGT